VTFEMIVYKAQVFAVKLQSTKPGVFLANLRIGFGALITQTLMGLCFAKIYSEGERQCLKQKRVKTVNKK